MPAKQKRNARKNGKVQSKGRGLFNYGPAVATIQRALRVRHGWSWSSSLSEAAAGAGASYSFAVNNAYDPNFTGVGAQPIGFDQYAALYARYRVLGCRYEIFAGTRTASPIRVGCYQSAQSTLPADPNAWGVQNASARVHYLGANTGGNNVVAMKGAVDFPTLFGITKNEFITEHDFVASTGAGPTRQGYLHFFIVCAGGVVAACDYTVNLFLDLEWSSPIALTQS